MAVIPRQDFLRAGDYARPRPRNSSYQEKVVNIARYDQIGPCIGQLMKQVALVKSIRKHWTSF